MFRTEYIPAPSPFKIDHSSKILTLGSCFADVLGKQLSEGKFSTLSNPLGIHYHPFSIFDLFMVETEIEDALFVERNGQSFHYLHHSSLSAESRAELQLKIDKLRENLKGFLAGCHVVVLTFGTAYRYTHLPTGRPVANCHKMPATLFRKDMTSVPEIILQFEKFAGSLIQENPRLQFILTVSPVRHIKDSIPLNSVSKSILRLACHELSSTHENVHYFPSFEIMMDDLRDYRFYKEDMIHPDVVAEKYIWQKFRQTFFTAETNELIDQWTKVQRDLFHKPVLPKSQEYKKFLEHTFGKLLALSKFLPLDAEINAVSEKLADFK